MKIQNYRLLGIVLFLSSLFGSLLAQDTLFFYNFQDQTLPTGWQNIDLDTNITRQNRPDAWYPEFDPLTTEGQDSNFVMSATSWFSQAGTSDNWLITDSFTVTDPNLWLVWKSAPFEGPVYMDGYSVKVSTTDSLPSSFSTTLMTFSEGIGNTANTTSGTAHLDFQEVGGVNRGVLEEWRVGLSGYVGQRIFIAFVHESEDDNYILLDDVLLTRVPEYDAAAFEPSMGLAYPQIPFSQNRTLQVGAKAQNRGGTALGKVVLNVTVERDALPQYIDTISVGGLLPGGIAELSPLNPFVPALTGTYTGIFSVSIDSLDGIPQNDTTMISFEVTDSIYARDNGQPASSFSFGSGQSGQIGQVFEMVNQDTLTSISFYLDSPTAGDTITATVRPFTNFPGEPLVTLDPYVVSGGSQWVTLPLPGGGKRLTTGEWWIGLEEANANSLNLGLTGGTSESTKVWQWQNGSWSNFSNIPLNANLMLRANFGPALNFVAREPELATTSAHLFPNPFQDRLYLKSNASILWVKAYDLMGREVWESTDLSKNMEINTSTWQRGLYVFRIYTQEGKTAVFEVIKP